MSTTIILSSQTEVLTSQAYIQQSPSSPTRFKAGYQKKKIHIEKKQMMHISYIKRKNSAKTLKLKTPPTTTPPCMHTNNNQGPKGS